ncbi:GAF domain-containing sensor histidine kinase [Amycolatopsis taiwanensis]|uniref:GAF domain-containing sensor histidine kinase n=1 Tax=Amycolatopsis taiwanensis TaxID=342230 RepID=UPI0004B1C759|nr:GAF domain-containing protein [Amycolatopsis taiwanensis]
MEPTLAAQALSAATDITTAALSGDEPDAVLTTVVRKAAELARADLGLVMVRADDGCVSVEAAHGAYEGDLRGLTLPAESSAGRVARGGETVVADDFTADPRTAPYVPDELSGFGPFAAAPFGAGGRVLGSLAVYRVWAAEPFSPATVEVLTAFAAQVGVVLALAEGATARHRVTLYQERERIARELHDVIVQRLYAAGMQLDRVRRRMRKRFAGTDAARLGEAIDQLDQTIDEIRATVRELRSPEPEPEPEFTPHTDLAESARGEVRIAGELLGFPPTLELSGEFADVATECADHIRAALREALSNVVRHSGASEVRVSLQREGGQVRLRVRDNGSGVPQGVATRGLRHLAERAESAGGKFYLNSSPSLGTLVAFDLPVDDGPPGAPCHEADSFGETKVDGGP